MSTYSVYVRAHLYSVHWEADRDHGYFHQHIRVLAKNADDAIRATKDLLGNEHAQKPYHVESVDLLAEDIRIMPSSVVLEECCVHNLYQPTNDHDLSNMLGATESEQFNGRKNMRKAR